MYKRGIAFCFLSVFLLLIFRVNSVSGEDDNQIPVQLSDFIEVQMNEDEPLLNYLNLSDHFHDPEDDNLSFRVQNQRHVTASIDQDTHLVSFIPDSNWSGEDTITIEARDDRYHTEDWNNVQINITVWQVNDPPQFNLVNDVPVSDPNATRIQDIQGAPLTLSFSASDPDEIFGDEFTFSTDILDKIPEEILEMADYQFVETTGSMSIFLSNDLVGIHFFNVSVIDEAGERDTIEIRLEVYRPPGYIPYPEFVHPLDEEVIYQEINGMVDFKVDPGFTDLDEGFMIDWEFGDGMILENGGTEASHHYSVSGYYTITASVVDDYSNSNSNSISIRVIVNGTSSSDCFVRGRVVDDSIEPLADVRIFVDGNYSCSTNSSGLFNISVPSSNITLSFSGKGIETRNMELDVSDGSGLDLGDTLLELDRGSEQKLQPYHLVLIFLITMVIIIMIILVFFIIQVRKKRPH